MSILTTCKPKFLTMLVGSMAVFGISSTAVADDSLLEKIKADKKVVVAHSNEAPNAYVNSKGELTGLIIELVTHAFNEIDPDIEIEGRRVDWTGLIPALQAKRVDMLAVGMYATPARCEQVLFSEPMFVAGQRIVFKKGNAKNIKDYNSIKDNPDIKMAVLAGAFEEPYLREMGINDDQLVMLPDNSSINSALLSDRVDAITVTGTAAQWVLEQYPDQLEGSEFIYDAGGHDVGGYYTLQYRFGDDELKDTVDGILAKYLKTDKFDELLKKYDLESLALPEKTIDQICSGD